VPDVSVTSDAVTVVVESDDNTVLISQSGFQGVPGPAHETYQFTMQDQIEPAVGTTYIPFDTSAQMLSVQAVTSVSPVGQDIVVDVLINGISVWSNPADRLTISAGQDESAVITAFDTDSFVAGDRLSVDVVQVGTTNPGEDLLVMVRVLRS
jgi:hypothetical protein